MSALDFLDEELALLEQQHRRRGSRVLGSKQGARIVLDGREIVSFSSNDYLGLAGHPALAEAAHREIDRAGVGAGASRLIVGNFDAHVELERALAELFGTAAARLFNSGFSANTGLIPVLVGEGDEVFSDELNHASIIDGCRLSRATVRVFRHKNVNDLDGMLARSTARRRLVITESVFSMDGDRADLATMRSMTEQRGAALVVDEAHATGVLGERGGGLLELAGVTADAVVGTLGKGLGAYGACVAGSVALGEVLWNRARSLVFTTGLPPMVAAAARAAVTIARGEEGAGLRRILWRRVEQLTGGLRELGLEVRASSPIVPLVVGDDAEVMAWTNRLLERGIYVQGVRPPTVPVGTARLRIAVSAAHSEDQVGELVAAIKAGLAAGSRFVSRGTSP